jgi:hypothetical protein
MSHTSSLQSPIIPRSKLCPGKKFWDKEIKRPHTRPDPTRNEHFKKELINRKKQARTNSEAAPLYTKLVTGTINDNLPILFKPIIEEAPLKTEKSRKICDILAKGLGRWSSSGIANVNSLSPAAGQKSNGDPKKHRGTLPGKLCIDKIDECIDEIIHNLIVDPRAKNED